jgi:energy-coupling factor transport system ATP-binding protein
MIRFENVSFAYRTPAATVEALRGVSFELAQGKTTVVLGANGSGKSTLARLVNGLLLPGEGCVEVDGLDTRSADSIWELRRRVGLVFQNPDNQIVGTTVEEDVAFGLENLGLPREEMRDRIAAALEAVGLLGHESREPHTLSGGQKQRLALAGALAMQPRYLVLDEPTSMLDSAGRADVLEVLARLRAQEHGTLHVTHDLSDMVSADEVLVLSDGEIALGGTPAEVLSDPERLAAWGLALPPIALLASELRGLGVPVPAVTLDAEGVVSALCRSS